MSASVSSLVSRGVPPGAVRVASELAVAPADNAVRQVLPVCAGLAALLPLGGLRCGSTVVVRGSTSLLFALLAAATANGSWAAVVGMPDLGVLAAAELGVAVPRLALVPWPGAEGAAVISALLDGVDLVAVASPGKVTGSDSTARRLSARARHRGAVLVAYGPWPGADLELCCTEISWSGLGAGYGYLSTGELEVSVRGRGAATRRTCARLSLPCGVSTLPALRPVRAEAG